MQKCQKNKTIIISLCALLASNKVVAVETSISGILDVRAYQVNNEGNAESYLKGDFGKFRFDEGSGVALGQLGAHLTLDWENNWSATLVANGFASRGDEAIGITEAYFNYKGLPSSDGWRVKSKIGVFYPKVSLENVATAWSTPYTITSSSLNNWVGEEFRSTGVNLSLERLGRFSNSSHTFSADVSLFQNNDPAGAMIAWHGWTIGSRQTLMHEKLKLQYFPARKGMLSTQAPKSDPFLELDDRWGTHLAFNWSYKNIAKLNLGYYDNQAEEGVVVDGQYTWTTEFLHIGFKYKPAKKWELIGQYMEGSTNMVSPYGERVVDNTYDNGFIMLRHFWDKHQVAVRLESFGVEDLDKIWGDNNEESGTASTLSYRYKYNRQNFILFEWNQVKSDRPARAYVGQNVDLTEQQIQLSYRYYFKH